MQLSKKQRFGIITFLVLILAAYLVTKEPWKLSTRVLKSTPPEMPPFEIKIAWKDLATGNPIASTTDTICSYTGFDLGYNERFEQASWVAYVLTRTDNFRTDTSIRSGPSSPGDYRGLWKKLEAQVREWAIEKDSLYVLTGPVLNQITCSIRCFHTTDPETIF